MSVTGPPDEQHSTLVDMFVPLAENMKALIVVPFAAAAIGLSATFVIQPSFTAATTLLPPEKMQSGSSVALQSLGALAGLAGVGAGKTTTDQFAALLQSVTIQDRLIDQFKLLEVYGREFRVDARRELGKHVRVIVGKRDGLVTVEVDDMDPQRAAAMANQHVEELRRLTSTLAMTEAQQRRRFFEGQLKVVHLNLSQAQRELQSSGYNVGALKAEPRVAADSYARLRADVAAAKIQLQTIRGAMSDGASEVRQQQLLLSALQAQLSAMEQSNIGKVDADYLGKYREFKYQETLLDLMARQYELARIDESREGALIQVVDVATPPERPSKPKRIFFTLGAAFGTTALLLALVYLRDSWQRALADPASAPSVSRLRRARDGRRHTGG